MTQVEDFSEADIYDAFAIDHFEDDGELDAEDAAFMQGYLSA